MHMVSLPRTLAFPMAFLLTSFWASASLGSLSAQTNPTKKPALNSPSPIPTCGGGLVPMLPCTKVYNQGRPMSEKLASGPSLGFLPICKRCSLSDFRDTDLYQYGIVVFDNRSNC